MNTPAATQSGRKRTVFFITVFILLIAINSTTLYSQDEWNLIRDATVTVSGYDEGFPPENMFSQGAPVCWAITGGGRQWIEVRFFTPANINRFELVIGHEYEGEPINVYGRAVGSNYKLLQHFQNEQLERDTLLSYSPVNPWNSMELVRIESPESPLTLCWRHLGLIGYIPDMMIPDLCENVPDLIFYNGTVITMDTAMPQAEAVAIKLDEIVGVGTTGEMMAMKSAACYTKLIDLNGLTILPGFNDAHSHIFSWPEEICKLTGDTSYPSLEDRVRKAADKGWTSISELAFGRPDDGSREHMDNSVYLDHEGLLPFRLNGYWGSLLDVEAFDVLDDSALYPRKAFSERVRVPGIKLYIDHPLGIDDGPYSQEQVNELVDRAKASGWQIAAHAVNHNGIEKILTAYENALDGESNENYRYRIEHAVKVSDDQLQRMKNKKIIASFQIMGPPDWPTQESHQMYISNTNPEWQMRWREFVDSGLVCVGSTDYPFNDAPCDYSPFRVIYQGVTRKGYIDRELYDWELNQRLTIEQSIRLLTIDGAHATFEENKKGSITTGKWADLVVVSSNPFTLSAPEDLLNIKNLLTMVGGKVEYCDNSFYPGLCPDFTGFSVNSAIISASDYISDQTPDFAYDGNNETGWGSGDFPPQWIMVDLTKNYKIGGIDLVVEQYPAGNTVHQILGKGNNQPGDMDLLHEFNGYTDDRMILNYIAPASLDSIRYIKVLTVESPSWVAWKEIIIYKNEPLTGMASPNIHSYRDELENINISPLPLDETSKIEFDIKLTTPLKITVTSINGSLVMDSYLSLLKEGHHAIFLSSLFNEFHLVPSGIYILRIETSNAFYLHKIVKQ